MVALRILPVLASVALATLFLRRHAGAQKSAATLVEEVPA